MLAYSSSISRFTSWEEAGSNFLRMPADFVIGPDGRLLHAHYADFVWDHQSLDTVAELAAAGVPGA